MKLKKLKLEKLDLDELRIQEMRRILGGSITEEPTEDRKCKAGCMEDCKDGCKPGCKITMKEATTGSPDAFSF